MQARDPVNNNMMALARFPPFGLLGRQPAAT